MEEERVPKTLDRLIERGKTLRESQRLFEEAVEKAEGEIKTKYKILEGKFPEEVKEKFSIGTLLFWISIGFISYVTWLGIKKERELIS